ncbi:hypothetical protein GCM10027562_02470 [Arthrobacter pigmenti]
MGMTTVIRGSIAISMGCRSRGAKQALTVPDVTLSRYVATVKERFAGNVRLLVMKRGQKFHGIGQALESACQQRTVGPE